MLIGSKLLVFYKESLRIFPIMAHKYANVSWANHTDHTEEPTRSLGTLKYVLLSQAKALMSTE